MATNKELKIGLKVDTKAGQGYVKLLNDMGAAGAKAAKIIQDISIGGKSGTVGAGVFAKTLLANKKALLELGAAGEKYSKVLSSNVVKAQEELGRRLDDNNKKFKLAVELQEKFEREAKAARASGLDPSFAINAARRNGEEADRLLAKRGQLSKASAELSDQAGPGVMDALKTAFPMLGRLLGSAGPLAAVAAAGYLANKGSQWYQSDMQATGAAAMMPLNTEVERAQSMGRYNLNRAQGNVLSEVFRRQMNYDPKLQAAAKTAEEVAMREAEYNATGVGSVMNFAGDIWSKGPTAAWKSLRAGQANVNETKLAAKERARADVIDKAAERDPVFTATLAQFESDKYQNFALARSLGVRPDSIIDMQTKQQERMMSFADQAAIRMGLKASGGWTADRLLGGTTRASVVGGMDIGAATQLAGAGLVQGDILGQLRGIGLGDPTIQTKLGQGVASFMGANSALGSMPGLVQAVASGVDYSQNSALQARAVAQNMAGMRAGGALFGGATPWQKSVNLSNAVGVMGEGSSLYAQNKLANLPFSTMIGLLNSGKELPASWAGMGITKSKMRKYADMTFSSSLAQFIDQGGTDEASKLAREIQEKHGGNIREWGRSFKGTKAEFEGKAQILGGLLSEVDQTTFGDETSAAGFVRVAAGRKTGGVPGKPGAAGPVQEDITTASVRAGFGALKTQLEELKTPFSELNSAVKNATTRLRLMSEDPSLYLGIDVQDDLSNETAGP